VKYFAYGSNLLPERLLRRVPSTRPLTTATVAGYALRFHKVGADMSGKCDAFYTGHMEDILFGALYEIAEADKPVLDRIEGAGYGISHLEVHADGEAHSAYAYIAEAGHIQPDVQPFDWYKAFVLHGAIHHGFPDSYIAAIDATTAVADPDRQRAAANRAILHAALNRIPAPYGDPLP
jgi:hypothetical protein